MRMANGGFSPGYNAQFATDVANGIIVGVSVTNSGSIALLGAGATDNTSMMIGVDTSAAGNVKKVDSIPLGRLGLPQDMANLIRFIVGPGASYITGQTIHSNGGAYLNL